MIQIPVFQNNSSDFEQEIDLANQLTTIRITYNVRVESFFLTITDQNGNGTLGIKITEDWPLLKQYKGSTDLRGDFIVFNTDESLEEITYENFGTSWVLYYITQAELDAWEVTVGLV